METIPCPGCRTDLEPSETVCPTCLRPRGKLEITRAYATLRQLERQRRQRPYVVAAYLAAAVATGWLAYRYHAPASAAFVSIRARVGRYVEETLDSAVPAANPPAVPPTSPAPVPSPIAAPAPPPAPARASPTKAGGPPARVEDLPLPAFDAVSQWVFHGRVYDLISLLPIDGAQLSFATAGGAGYGNVRSDANGRFAAVLNRMTEGSYEIHASRSGYAPLALYEPDIPYARLPLAQRRDIALSAQDGDMPLPPLIDIAGEGSIRRDVFLAPSR